MKRLWYENAVIYSLDVRTFQDSDGDGVGDFDGLTGRLDYLASLGVTALWLLPFLPTPYADNGYDVTDYFDVEDELGGIPAFTRFARRAAQVGLRLIVDLPLNHTSVEHPWFEEARSDRDSRYRDFYIWADEPPADSPEQIVFRGEEPHPWTFDDEAQQYYLHRFYESEPDLNHANPEVRERILEILEFWTSMGASAIRIDAAPYIAKKSGAEAPQTSPHAFLEEMNERVRAVSPDAALIGEADVKPAELSSFFGDGAQLNLLFNFLLNNYFFLALARQEAEPLIKALGSLPHVPKGCGWLNWIRNHDELDLERLTSHERADVMSRFAPEEDMRIYGRGIRRRFPPMVDGDLRQMELAYSLLFALPGNPIIRYGEEIGMGDDLSLVERDAVRLPMQWRPIANGGFSDAPAEDLRIGAVRDGPFGYETVNVADQHRQRDSFLSRIHLMIAVRRQHPEIARSAVEIISTADPAVLGLRYDGHEDEEELIILHNLGDSERTVTLEQFAGRSLSHGVMSGDGEMAIDESKWEVRLPAYGYLWFVVAAGERADVGESARAATGAMRDRESTKA